MRSGFELSSDEARWLAVEAQGLSRPRPAGSVGPRRLRAVVERLGAIQLDAVNVGKRGRRRAPSFERVYDLAERVLPEAVLAQPTPSIDQAHRRLLALAAASLGVATSSDLASYYVIKPKAAKARVAELVEAGELIPVAVDGWEAPAYTVPDARPKRPSRGHATLLSPFDSLIWDRNRTRRLFAFDYRIEIYVPERDREYGYFVLPLLLGNDLVARFDLKADRKPSLLRVRGAYLEPGADEGAVSAAAATELAALRDWLGLGDIAIGPRGDLSKALQQAIG